MAKKTAAPPQNTQAMFSLLLGCISFIAGILAILLFRQIGVVSLVAMLLCSWASLRGLFAARQLGGKGRRLVYIGLLLAVIGLVISVLAFVLNLDNRAPAAGTDQVFQRQNFTMRYPTGWQQHDMGQDAFCNQATVDCLVTLGHPDSATRVSVVRYALSQPATAQEIDTSFWSGFAASNPGVIVDSLETPVIGGIPTVKRLYHMPVNAAGQMPYMMQVIMVREMTYYQFTATFPSRDELARQQATVEAIANSMLLTG